MNVRTQLIIWKIRIKQADDATTDKPNEDPKVQSDPLKTLFVGRLSYSTEKRDLEREFGRYGPIADVSII